MSAHLAGPKPVHNLHKTDPKMAQTRPDTGLQPAAEVRLVVCLLRSFPRPCGRRVAPHPARPSLEGAATAGGLWRGSGTGGAAGTPWM